MEASAIRQLGVVGAHGRSPLLRLQSDERLVGLVRRGNQHAFEALVSRYESRLLAFCRHMLSSREDAEDVLQEVFTAAFHAMLSDDRPINVRPWLYRIARNRSLNHLRRVQAVGVDSMDTHFSEHGISTAEKAHRREDFRLLIADVQELPETQRTALLLREIDALSYEQIAEAMDNTVPSVKSLLVRARVGLAEAAEARLLDCDVVRLELGEVAEGLKRMSSPVRRHVRICPQCSLFREHLKSTNRQLAALLPVGPLLILKKTLLAHIGSAAAASGGTATAGSAAGGALQLTLNAAAGKAAAGLAAAAIVTAGAVEAKHVAIDRGVRPAVVVSAAQPSPAPSSSVAPSSASVPAVSLPALGPALDPFAAPAGAALPADGDKRAPAADEPAPQQDKAGDAPADALEPEATTDATVTPTLVGATPSLADATPVSTTGDPSVTAVPGVTPAKPPATPEAVAPTASPMLVEGVVRPTGTALGTPATGVVTPDSAPKPAQPVVEAIPPAVVTQPVATAPVVAAPAAGPGTGGEPTGAVEAPAAEPAPTPDEPQPEPAPTPAPADEPQREPAPAPAPAPAVVPEAPAPAAPPADSAPEPARAPEPAPTGGTVAEPALEPAPTGGTAAEPASEEPAPGI